MTANKFSQLGSIIRSNTAQKAFSGIKTSGNVNALAMQSRKFVGGFRGRGIPVSTTNTIFRANIHSADDPTAVTGP